MKTLTAILSDLAPGGDFNVASDRLPQSPAAYDACVVWRGPGDKPTWDELIAHLAELERPTPEAQRAAAQLDAQQYYARFLSMLTQDAPPEEVATFQPKRMAAQAFAAGSPTEDDLKLLRGVASKIGADEEAAAERILQLSAAYTSGVERAEAIHGAHRRAIDSADDADIETAIAAALENAKADYATALEDLAATSDGE